MIVDFDWQMSTTDVDYLIDPLKNCKKNIFSLWRKVMLQILGFQFPKFEIFENPQNVIENHRIYTKTAARALPNSENNHYFVDCRTPPKKLGYISTMGENKKH